MTTYEFDTVDDFVKYLDTRAKDMRSQSDRLHPRTHNHAALRRGAAEIESIAAIVRSSNLIVCNDYVRQARL